MKKNNLTLEKKSQIIQLCAMNLSRTFIAKKLNIKNKTLERLCELYKIPLPRKGIRPFIKEKAEGLITYKNSVLYFPDLYALYYLIKFSMDENVTSIESHSQYIKILCINGDIKVIDKKNQNAKATVDMISNLVENQRIKFTSDYFNKKFHINYEL